MSLPALRSAPGRLRLVSFATVAAESIACDLQDAGVIPDLTTAEGRGALVDSVTRLSQGRVDAIVGMLSMIAGIRS